MKVHGNSQYNNYYDDGDYYRETHTSYSDKMETMINTLAMWLRAISS